MTTPSPALSTPSNARRQFSLPGEDLSFLDSRGRPWETVTLDGTQWLFVHNFPVPPGLSVPEVTVAVRIVPGYPAAALDMIYVYPAIARVDGRPIPSLAQLVIDGREFQQWSRHYSGVRPWRPDIDNVESHLRAAEEWLRRAAA